MHAGLRALPSPSPIFLKPIATFDVSLKPLKLTQAHCCAKTSYCSLISFSVFVRLEAFRRSKLRGLHTIVTLELEAEAYLPLLPIN